jgi:putative transposase
VWSRGSNRGVIFILPGDRVDFLSRFGKAATRHEWRVLAYCLLTNHYHAVLQIPEGGLSEGMQLLNGTFSRRQSVRYARTAHLFRNRFGCRRIERAGDLVGAIRYVLRNPVAAGLCEHPAGWPWSSYRASVGAVSPPSWLDVPSILALFREFDPDNPARGLKRFVENRHAQVSDTKTRPKWSSPEP